MKWFRFYSEFMDDPKIAMMSDSDQLLWVKALCLANENKKRGYITLSDQEVCWKLRISIESWKHAIDKFRAKGMIEHCEEGYRIVNWDKRQFDSDSSAERVAAYRARQQQSEQKREARNEKRREQYRQKKESLSSSFRHDDRPTSSSFRRDESETKSERNFPKTPISSQQKNDEIQYQQGFQRCNVTEPLHVTTSKRPQRSDTDTESEEKLESYASSSSVEQEAPVEGEPQLIEATPAKRVRQKKPKPEGPTAEDFERVRQAYNQAKPVRWSETEVIGTDRQRIIRKWIADLGNVDAVIDAIQKALKYVDSDDFWSGKSGKAKRINFETLNDKGHLIEWMGEFNKTRRSGKSQQQNSDPQMRAAWADFKKAAARYGHTVEESPDLPGRFLLDKKIERLEPEVLQNLVSFWEMA